MHELKPSVGKERKITSLIDVRWQAVVNVCQRCNILTHLTTPGEALSKRLWAHADVAVDASADKNLAPQWCLHKM
jgi:hypothetical protein